MDTGAKCSNTEYNGAIWEWRPLEVTAPNPADIVEIYNARERTSQILLGPTRLITVEILVQRLSAPDEAFDGGRAAREKADTCTYQTAQGREQIANRLSGSIGPSNTLMPK